MAEDTKVETTTEVAEQTQIQSPNINQIMDSFDESWEAPEAITGQKETTQTVESDITDETDTKVKLDNNESNEEKNSEDIVEIEEEIIELLDMELKRFDEKMTLKEYLAKHPEDVKEVLQKKWDYDARREGLRKEKAEIEQEKKSIETVRLRNLAYEINMPIKTLADFEADTRFEDPEKSFNEYVKNWKEKATNLVSVKEQAELANAEMIEDFQEEFKDVPVDEIFEKVKPYLNASVSMGHIPFPKDALKIFYQGINYDSLVDKAVKSAREDERKKVYAELKQNPDKIKLDKTPTSQNATKEALSEKSNMTKRERAFEEAWTI